MKFSPSLNKTNAFKYLNYASECNMNFSPSMCIDVKTQHLKSALESSRVAKGNRRMPALVKATFPSGETGKRTTLTTTATTVVPIWTFLMRNCEIALKFILVVTRNETQMAGQVPSLSWPEQLSLDGKLGPICNLLWRWNKLRASFISKLSHPRQKDRRHFQRKKKSKKKCLRFCGIL